MKLVSRTRFPSTTVESFNCGNTVFLLSCWWLASHLIRELLWPSLIFGNVAQKKPVAGSAWPLLDLLLSGSIKNPFNCDLFWKNCLSNPFHLSSVSWNNPSQSVFQANSTGKFSRPMQSSYRPLHLKHFIVFSCFSHMELRTLVLKYLCQCQEKWTTSFHSC